MSSTTSKPTEKTPIKARDYKDLVNTGVFLKDKYYAQENYKILRFPNKANDFYKTDKCIVTFAKYDAEKNKYTFGLKMTPDMIKVFQDDRIINNVINEFKKNKNEKYPFGFKVDTIENSYTGFTEVLYFDITDNDFKENQYKTAFVILDKNNRKIQFNTDVKEMINLIRVGTLLQVSFKVSTFMYTEGKNSMRFQMQLGSIKIYDYDNHHVNIEDFNPQCLSIGKLIDKSITIGTNPVPIKKANVLYNDTIFKIEFKDITLAGTPFVNINDQGKETYSVGIILTEKIKPLLIKLRERICKLIYENDEVCKIGYKKKPKNVEEVLKAMNNAVISYSKGDIAEMEKGNSPKHAPCLWCGISANDNKPNINVYYKDNLLSADEYDKYFLIERTIDFKEKDKDTKTKRPVKHVRNNLVCDAYVDIKHIWLGKINIPSISFSIDKLVIKDVGSSGGNNANSYVSFDGESGELEDYNQTKNNNDDDEDETKSNSSESNNEIEMDDDDDDDNEKKDVKNSDDDNESNHSDAKSPAPSPSPPPPVASKKGRSKK